MRFTPSLAVAALAGLSASTRVQPLLSRQTGTAEQDLTACQNSTATVEREVPTPASLAAFSSSDICSLRKVAEMEVDTKKIEADVTKYLTDLETWAGKSEANMKTLEDSLVCMAGITAALAALAEAMVQASRESGLDLEKLVMKALAEELEKCPEAAASTTASSSTATGTPSSTTSSATSATSSAASATNRPANSGARPIVSMGLTACAFVLGSIWAF